ncbi:transposase [Nostoc sp. DSM 114160]
MKNWNAYDPALKQRGSITFWVNEQIIEQWRNQQKTGRKGASNYYSDVAIATPIEVDYVDYQILPLAPYPAFAKKSV